MGNRASKAENDDWISSDEGGGSDYEHAYDYHTSVLNKSPADGFESDYEEDDDDGPRKALQALSSNKKTDSKAHSVNEKGDGQNGKRTSSGLMEAESGSGPKQPAASVAVTDSGDGKQSDTVHNIDGYTEDNGQKAAMCASGIVAEGDIINPPDVGLASRATSEQSKSRQHINEENGALRQQAESERSSPLQQSQSPTPHNNHITSQPQVPPSQQQVSAARPAAPKVSALVAEGEEAYETAREGKRDDEGGESDDGSLSTITPPRQRPPSSESEYTASMHSHSGEEDSDEVEDEESYSDSDSDLEEDDSKEEESEGFVLHSQKRCAPSTIPRASASQHYKLPGPSSRTASLRSHDCPPPLPPREGRSPNSYRQARKRHASPDVSTPSKRSKPSDGVQLSPNKVRYGVFDSESEPEAPRHNSRNNSSALSAFATLGKSTRSVSTRTLRQAAKSAATKFVETSRKILRDAKTAARMLKQAASPPKRRPSNPEVIAAQRSLVSPRSSGQRSQGQSSCPLRETRNSSRWSAAEQRRVERLSLAAESSRSNQQSPPSRRRAGKRKADERESDIDTEPYMPHHTESEQEAEDVQNIQRSQGSLSWRQVRKDGGRLRKFTRSAPAGATSNAHFFGTRHSPRLFAAPTPPNIRSNSQPSFVAPTAWQPPVSSAAGQRGKGRQPRPSSPLSTSNPFHNVTLVPTSSASNLNNSVDSITHELEGHGLGTAVYSPFVSLSKDVGRDMTPPSAILTSGSVWSRINTCPAVQPSSGQKSPQPGPSGLRRSSPRFSQVQTPSSTAGSNISPSRNSPRVQFASSGRFAFLLEDTLQVTVAASDITMATTSAIVVTTDSQLRPDNPVAESVARAAGSGFAQACQDYLKQKAGGLKVCEIVDAPAGGHLCPLISHVLMVVPPDVSTHNMLTQRKLLLCTYLNCLKHASEKLGLTGIAFPLIGSGIYSTDDCIQVFFDSMLVYLAERTDHCPLYAVQLIVGSPAVGRFAAEVMDARLDSVGKFGVDPSITAAFRDYFNIPSFSRSMSAVSFERTQSGKPALKRRKL